eukprot:4062384-Lingulodinium_polyedra.AAC.1
MSATSRFHNEFALRALTLAIHYISRAPAALVMLCELLQYEHRPPQRRAESARRVHHAKTIFWSPHGERDARFL